MDFISLRPGFAFHPLLGQELPLVAFFTRLQEENVSSYEKRKIKELLKIQSYIPVGVFFPELEVHGETIVVFPRTGYQFQCKMEKLDLKAPLVLNHPMRYISLSLNEEQIKALQAYKERYDLIYK